VSELTPPVPLSAADIDRLADALAALARTYRLIGRDTAPLDELLGRLRGVRSRSEPRAVPRDQGEGRRSNGSL